MNANGITEFLAVARAGTFTGAAQGLGVSVPHVSRQVARLEQRLGVKLFQRNTRSVFLTPSGETLRSNAEKISDDLEAALLEVSNTHQKLEGRLRIASLSGSFADQVVGPAMVELAAEHPALEIEVDFNARKVDILREGYDLAIRSGQMESSGLISRPLSNRTLAAAASKEYIEQHGEPQHPRELADHSCIRTNAQIWRFIDEGKILNIPIKSRLHFNAGPAILDACAKGLGIAYMASAGYEDTLLNGSLTPILKKFWRTERSVHIVRVDRQFTPRCVQMAISRLEEVAKKVETKEATKLQNIHE